MNGPANFYGIGFSDHRNYWHFDFPAVMVTDTAFLRNPAYHTAEDTHDKLNYVKMAQVIDQVFGLVSQFDFE